MAQLVERSILTPKDQGSNPVVGNFYLNLYLLLPFLIRKTKIREACDFIGNNFPPTFISDFYLSIDNNNNINNNNNNNNIAEKAMEAIKSIDFSPMTFLT